jgi:ribosome-binding factor A
MLNNRNEKLQEALRNVCAEFLAREAGRQSLITVTRAILSSDGHSGTVYMTVFPDQNEESALKFANRNRTELAEFFKKRVRGAQLPRIEFVIDRGEKNRQRLDEIS